jgi:hypothetical protein
MPSSIRPTRDSQVRLRAAPEEVTVGDWGLRDRPLGSSVAVTVAAGASWVAAWGTGNMLAGLLVAAVLAIILWRTWLPVRYQLSGSGVAQSIFGWRRQVPWTAIQSHEVKGSGVLLLADAGQSPLGPLRGFFVPWGNHRELILAQLGFYLPNSNGTAPDAPQPPAQ